MTIYILVFIIFIFIVIFSFDAIPQFYTWQSRIKIGRLNEDNWQEKVAQISRKWLKKSPTIPLTDQNRLIFIDILNGNFHRKSIQSWQEASLLLGLNDVFTIAKNPEIKKEISNLISTKINSNGNWKVKYDEIDAVILAFAIMKAEPENIPKYKLAYDYSYQLILSLIGDDGTVAYRNHRKELRFVDTIGFICPFLINYSLHFNQPKAFDLAMIQITNFQRFGWDEKLNLPCHSYDFRTEKQVGLVGWGRGFAWYIIGILDSYILLDENHSQKSIFRKTLLKIATTSLQYQKENGSFGWLLTDEFSNSESSITAVLVWLYAECEIFSEDSSFSIAKNKALHYLKSVTRRNGVVDFSQGDTKGIGVYSMNFDRLPFTQGFVLRTIKFESIPQPQPQPQP